MTNKEAQITINAIKFMLDNAQYSEDVEEALDMAIETLSRSETPNGWIPCSERLPDMDEYVLCTVNDQGEGNEVVLMCLTTSIRTGDYYWTDYAMEYSWELCEVFAWMPLPEPWKGADDEID